MTNLVHFEPLVNSTIVAFVNALETQFADKKDGSDVCDFGTWLHYFAFDIIGEITWSRRLGFIDQGIDVEGIIQMVQDAFADFAVVRVLRNRMGDSANIIRLVKCRGWISSGGRTRCYYG